MFPARLNSLGYAGIGSAVSLLIVLSALTTLGQSGRRGSKSPPVSVATPEPSPVEKKPVANNQARVTLILGTDRGDSFSGISPYYYDSVLESCAKRLDDSSGVRLEVVPREMTRGDAVKRAKAETEGFVAWLQLRADSSSASGTDPSEIYIEYVVFDATTAKIRAQGHAYQGARNGGLSIPGTSGRTSTMIAERRLRDAAQDVAERILKAIHLASPSSVPPH